MADVPFHIHYRLDGAGWATCDVSHGEKRVTVTASYLSDALGQLAAGALMLRLGAPSVRISFDEEPGQYRWGFDWDDGDDVGEAYLRVRIWWFRDLWSRLPDDDGELRFESIVSYDDVCSEVVRALDEVLATHGEAGYRKQWRTYEFPKAILDELRRLTRK